ncbi:GNAT family N-acetyltransferase [Saccharothrix sp. Mg75]|uniref:GNAT family N-acetyltransferase n=1 Tax=Saccharothrix sp. Mg75 TaxID=3445357 RepID=UPI003EEB60D4
MDVELAPAAKPVLAALLQLYLHDFSEVRPMRLGADGTFPYPYLDAYFGGAERDARLITVSGEPAGFAMARGDVHDDGSWNVAEFFVVRGHRGTGVAREAARRLFALRPGGWTLRFDDANPGAAAFWRAVVASVAVGPVVETRHTDPAPATGLRFRVAGA